MPRRKSNKNNRLGAYIFIFLLGIFALGAGIFAAIYQENRERQTATVGNHGEKPRLGLKTSGVIKKRPAPGPSAKTPVKPETEPEGVKPESKKPTDNPTPDKNEPSPSSSPEKPVGRPSPRKTESPDTEGEAVVAIVIDDFGNTMKNTDLFISLEAPVTFAVLPKLPHSSKISWKARQAGKEVILHLPLENKAGINPGPGTITTEMTDEEIEKEFNDNIATVPGAVGFNNHEGSRATEDERVMNRIMSQASEKGLFFVDSYTSSASVGIKTARSRGMAAARRNVFLDNEDDIDYISGQIRELAKKAKAEGKAIGIGHCRKNTYEAIKKMTPVLAEEGIRIVPVSRIVQ